MTKDEALQMCLEYIETDAHERKYVRHAIKQALAAPIQKPVATYKGPEELWLQLHGDCSDDELTEPVDYTDSSVTWCWHQIHDSDVRYVRADTIPPAAPVQEPVAILKGIDEYGPVVDWCKHWVTVPIGTKFYTTPPAQPAPVQGPYSAPVKEMWPVVPDAIGPNEDELPAYAAGWNDCRAEMLRGKP